MGHHIKVMLREAAVLSNCGTLKTTSLPVCSLLAHRLHTPLCCVQLSLANGHLTLIASDLEAHFLIANARHISQT